MAILIGRFGSISQASTSSTDWYNIDNAVDTTDGTYANVTVTAVSGSTKYSETCTADYNTIDTTRSDYILSVEVGLKGYASINNNDYKTTVLGGYNPIYGSGGAFITLTTSLNTYWHNITDDVDFPGYGRWQWSDIDNLQVYFRTHSYGDDPSPAAITTYVDEVYIRIVTSPNPIPFYGLQCWDSTGNQTLKVTDRITRVLFKQEVASLNSSYADFPIPEGGSGRTFGFSYALDGLTGGLPHTVSVTQISSTHLRVTWNQNSVFLSGPDVYIVPSAPSLIVVLGW